ncbi:MbcA/ParS/Xre antitoxin family protein [Alcanivorax quisquiliarum]|uniref:MbcA/ParS/Xre antitoxin family protein n=1 Tax=Alcanivorax quisquiliarum TaxID=2933565 RepID=A0ABT0E5P1_9GAMM|nr:MbcA/ParS/Xre antitoxin family protein [Alcanivorax quisquiliarum]MCK0536967.1 MbcA/ParS/Xre antitoxin family protein [Alcanivorax quisquiliarum]
MDSAAALNDTDRSRISKMLMTLFEHWKLSTSEQLSLLGLSKENRAALSNYRQGRPLANDRDKLERAGILLGIHKSLRLLFPHNPELAYGWMQQPNRAFHGLTPVQLVDQQGMIGMYMVRAYLDRQRGQ